MVIQESELFPTDGATAPQLNPELQHGSKGVNLGRLERVVSFVAGLTMVGYGLRRRTLPTLTLALAGGSFIHRAVTGRSRWYALLGLSMVASEETGVRFEHSIVIQRSRLELYRVWRDFGNLPRFLKHLQAVHTLHDGRSHWMARGPAGTTYEWTSRITEDREGEHLAWETLPGSRLRHNGAISFTDAPGDRGTVVHLRMRYDAPGGKVGLLLARLFGPEPKQELVEGLRRFKQLMETGEIATVEPQPSGPRSLLGKALVTPHA